MRTLKRPLAAIGLMIFAASSAAQEKAMPVHGYGSAQMLPVPANLALAATWDPALVREVHAVAGQALRDYGSRRILGPSLEIARDPRRGRIQNSFGEDSYLVSELGVAAIEGLRGSGPTAAMIAVGPWAGPQLPAENSEVGPVPVSERELRETYFPPFEAAVRRAKVDAIVASRGEIDGIPVHANRWLLTGVLRDEWKFSGEILATQDGIKDLHAAYGVAASAADADRVARGAGIVGDTRGMVTFSAKELRLSAEGEAVAARAAARSVILLKNDGVLPLSPQARVQLFEVTRTAFASAQLQHHLGLLGRAAAERVSGATHAIVAVDWGVSPDRVAQSIEDARRLGVPVIVVLKGDKPGGLDARVVQGANAVIAAWGLGSRDGFAAAAVLTGSVNPGGKLPVTIARNDGQLPLFYDAKPSARRGYLFDTSEPLFPFGFGLSYTTFEIGVPRLSAASIAAGGAVTVSVDVKNTGALAGDETVQLYVRDKVASAARPIKQLRGFQRVTLARGEQRTLAFTLGPEAFQMWDVDMKRVIEPGEFDVMAGTSSAQVQAATLTITGGAR